MLKSVRLTRVAVAVLLGLAGAIWSAPSSAVDERFITVASTTSTENSGLFGYILPTFEKDTNIQVRVVAVGTGQALRLAERGDADVLLVHHKPSEEKFVAEGYGIKRYDVMYNDFVLVGPRTDPASVSDLKDIVIAMQRIASKRAVFVSRGDDSGTHKLEQALWKGVGIDVHSMSGTWCQKIGSGMGATLNTASGLDAYTLSDRGTWISFGNKGELVLLVEGDPRLFNQYGVILVNPSRHQHVKAEDGRVFIDWLRSPKGQQAIADFRIDGEQLFFPKRERLRQRIAVILDAGAEG